MGERFPGRDLESREASESREPHGPAGPRSSGELGGDATLKALEVEDCKTLGLCPRAVRCH